MKASRQEDAKDYQGILDPYLQLIRRDTSRARYFREIGAMYDTLGIRDSAVYFYSKALEKYRKR